MAVGEYEAFRGALLLDSGVFCSTTVREAHLLSEGPWKRRGSRRKGGQQVGWTPSAHPRPWNPPRAFLECFSNSANVPGGPKTGWHVPDSNWVARHL